MNSESSRRKWRGCRRLASAAAMAAGVLSQTQHASAQQLVSNGESYFTHSETDTFSTFTTNDLFFNTSTSSTITFTLSPVNSSTPVLNVAFGGLTQTGTLPATITGGVLTSSGGELDVSVASLVSINSALANYNSTTPLLLTVNGPGTLVLTNTSTLNNISGGIDLESGTLRISSDLNLGGDAGNTDGVNFGGGILEASASINFSTARIFNVSANGGTFLADSGTTSTISGANQLIGSGGGTFIKDGLGTLILGASNSFSAPVTINNGTLELHDLNSLGAVGTKSAITLNNGAELNLRSDGPFVVDSRGNNSASFGNNIVINGASTTIDVGHLSSTTPGNLQLGSLSFPISSTLNVTNSQGSNDRSLEITGTTVLGQGGTSSAVVINNTATLLFSGQVTGNGSLAKTGSGTVYLSGTTANTYTGLTNVSGGTLVLQKTQGNVSIPGNLIINSGTVLLNTSQQIASTSTVQIFGGLLNLNNQNDTIFSFNNNGGTVVTGRGTLSVTSPNTTEFISGTTTINPGGVINATHLELQGGVNEVQPSGLLSVGSVGLFVTAEAPAAGQPMVTPEIMFDSDLATPGQIQLLGPFNFTSMAGSSNVGVLASIGTQGSAGSMDLGGATRVFTILTGQMNISTAVLDGGVDKEGAGILLLSGANTYTLGTTVGGGTLEVANPSGFGSGPVNFMGGVLDLRTDAASANFSTGSTLSSSSASTSISLNIDRVTAGTPGAFTINIGGLSIGAAVNVTGNANGTVIANGPVTLLATPVITSTANLALNASISGAYGITVTGAGVLSFGGTANNTYTGLTTVNAGTLLLNKSSATAIPAGLTISTSGIVNLGASEQISDTATVTFNAQTSLSVFNLNGFTETVGTLTDGGSGGIYHSIKLGSGGTLAFGGSDPGSTSFSGVVSGSGLLVKNGTQTDTFSGTNTYTGGLTVNSGTLAFTNTPAQIVGNNLSGGVWTVFSGGTLTLPGSVNILNNLGTIVLSGASPGFAAINSLNNNLGTLTITNGNAFSRSSFANTGTVNVGSGNASSFTVTTSLSQYSGGTLTGGTWNALPGGTITFPSGDNINTIGSPAVVNLSGGTFSSVASVNNSLGTFTVSAQNFTTAGNFNSSGTLNIGGSSVASIFTINGTLAQVSGNTLTAGTINIFANGKLVLGSGSINTIGPGAAVSLSGANASFPALTNIISNKGILSLSGSAPTLASNFTNDGTLTLAGSFNIGGGVFNATGVQGSAGSLIVPAGATLITTFIRQNSVTIGGTVNIQPMASGGQVSLIPNLTMLAGGIFDVANSDLVVRNSSAGAVNPLVASAYNGGMWNGTGITSSNARVDTTHLTALGVLLNKNSSGGALYPTFEGQAVTSMDVLVKYTYYGDTNLDGKVDGSDYSNIDNGYLNQTTGWGNGDLNYDSTINGSDYALIDNAYNRQGAKVTAEISGDLAGPQAGVTDQLAGVSAVPEPKTMAITLLAGSGLLRRRRSRLSSTGCEFANRL